jgi:signal peptidase I
MAIAGCGSATDPTTALRMTFTRYEAAVAEGNPEAACGYMAAAVQQRVAAMAAGSASESCPLAFGRELLAEDSASRARQRELAATLAVRVISVRDGHATVLVLNRLGSLTETGAASAVLERGRWRISQFPSRETVGRYLVYRVPSAAMVPTLKPGSMVLVDPAAFTHRLPAIGDVVLLHPPANEEVGCAARGEGMTISGVSASGVCDAPGATSSPLMFVKRIVAGPGDTVSIRRGQVIRNRTLESAPFATGCAGLGCTFPRPARIPAGTWFVVGDDRAQSADSREWGPVRNAWIVGRLVRVIG